MRDLPEILRGGYCTRWHANPDLAHIRETLAEHHARVAQIILALHPQPSVALIDAALHHDAGEPAVGDLPWFFKQAHPQIAADHAAVEADVLAELGCSWPLSPEDVRWIKFADRLAAYAHVAQMAPAVLQRDDWQCARADLVTAFQGLGDEGVLANHLRRIEGRA